MCFLRVRTVYELCQGELILDVANYDNDNVFEGPPKRVDCTLKRKRKSTFLRVGDANQPFLGLRQLQTASASRWSRCQFQVVFNEKLRIPPGQ